jgi:hypothetical protein
METANKIELHYFLKDKSHLIDAFVKHKCETELLAIAKDLITTLELDVHILSEAQLAGGIKEFWKFLGKNGAQLALIIAIVNAVLTRIPVSNKELEKSQIENIQLDNEVKRLTIEKLKKELNKVNIDTNIIHDSTNFFCNDYKIIKHKSNFYETLQNYPNVTQISTTSYHDNQQLNQSFLVQRKDFHKFILYSNILPEKFIDNAIVEIISPVLKNGKYKWRGIYNGETIDFTMKDEKYKYSVMKKEISFQSGYFIECVLKISSKIDDLGNIQNTGYTVTTVLGKIDDNKIIETEQGKRFKKLKEDIEKQEKLF